MPFIEDGLAAGQPVAAAVPGPRLQVLRDALGGTAEQVRLIDMAEAGRNPGRIIAEVLCAFADAHPDRQVRIVGEPIWPGRTVIEYPACVQHEALINPAFGGRNVTIVCPYDADRLDEQILSDARVTHPELWENGRHQRSRHYAPTLVLDRYNQPLPIAADNAFAYVARIPADLPAVRHFAADTAQRFGSPADLIEDLKSICTELVSNSLIHTATGESRVRIWRTENGLTCEVADTGTIDDPLVGRRPADPLQRGGRGLLLVNQLADLVRVHTAPDETTIQVYLRFRPD